MEEIERPSARGTRSCWRSAARLAALACAVSWLGALPGGLGGVGSAAAEEGHRFTVLRASKLLIRIDSRTGQVWITPSDGDGGWKRVGAAVTEGGSEENGRYQVRVLGPQRSSTVTIGPSAQQPPELIRMDVLTGRAWLADARSGAVWSELEAAKPGPAAGS